MPLAMGSDTFAKTIGIVRAPKGDDGRFDLYVAMDGRSDQRDLE
jgi:hypothetical protein